MSWRDPQDFLRGNVFAGTDDDPYPRANPADSCPCKPSRDYTGPARAALDGGGAGVPGPDRVRG